MRLLHARDHYFEEFYRFDIPKYAILSHCWSSIKGNEMTLHDWHQESRVQHPGYKKIEECCMLARSYNPPLEWVWVDTVCKLGFACGEHARCSRHTLIVLGLREGIDKTNSVELSEAINSMFAWYFYSTVCFVILIDLQAEGLDYNNHREDRDELARRLAESRWFSRGWTLQELIAPRDQVLFFDASLQLVGTRSSLASTIALITRIPEKYLHNSKIFREASVAQRMNWASTRDTTRVEDAAYCLLVRTIAKQVTSD